MGEGSTEVGRVIDERALVLLRDDEENMEKILDFLFSSTLPDMAGSDELESWQKPQFLAASFSTWTIQESVVMELNFKVLLCFLFYGRSTAQPALCWALAGLWKVCV